MDEILEVCYREHLEEDIIFCIAKRRNISNEEAMKIYYGSMLADKIHEGKYGIQYLDCENLADILEKEIDANKGNIC